MPSYDVTIGGKAYHVEIPDPGATPLQVIVDGQSFEVGIVGTEIRVTPILMAPAPPPAPSPTQLPLPPKVPVARPVAPVGSEAQDAISAPMPGTILSIAVQIGEHVEAGAVLCVLEAMKMKNPIRATHPGTVLAIHTLPGQTVAYGDPLVLLS